MPLADNTEFKDIKIKTSSKVNQINSLFFRENSDIAIKSIKKGDKIYINVDLTQANLDIDMLDIEKEGHKKLSGF